MSSATGFVRNERQCQRDMENVCTPSWSLEFPFFNLVSSSG